MALAYCVMNDEPSLSAFAGCEKIAFPFAILSESNESLFIISCIYISWWTQISQLSETR